MLNDQQIAALDRHVHLAVVANAGSGKTSVLVERFMRILLLDSVRLDQVVAITFTRAAAAEMRQRLQEKIDSISASEKEQLPYLEHVSLSTLKARLRALSAQIGTARISTFHSFCAGLVRQFADVVGRSSDVRDADSRLAAELLSEAVDRAMKGLLGPSSINDPDIQQMLDVITPWTVSTLVTQMTRSSAQRREYLASCALPMEELRAQRERSLVQIQLEVGIELAARLHAHIQPYRASLPALDALCEQLRDLQWRCSQSDPTAPAELVHLHDKWFTQKREIRSAAIPKDQRGPELPSPFSNDLKLNLTILSTPWDDAVEQRQIQVMRALGKLAEAAAQEYAELKHRRNVIDFDDMIDDAMQLLRHEDTSSVIRQSIAYVMIDEFQDTDPTQYELLELLAPALSGCDASGPNVYVVGDDKQSIYGFRDADVRLFRRARRAIRMANAIGSQADSGIRPLAMSFRMHQMLIAGINDVCRHAFGSVAAPDEDDEVSYDVAYLDLEAGIVRDESPSLASVRLVEIAPEDLRKQGEFAAVARQVAYILHPTSGSMVFDKEHPARAPRPADVAVLVPRNADKAMMAEALREYGIPYKVYGGRAFFSRPEIADIRAALTAAADPLNDLATATALRSSLLRCSDDDILAASLLGRTTSLQDGLEILAASGEASPEVIKASSFFDHLRTMLSLHPVSEVIGPMLSRCNWYNLITHEPRSQQMMANVEKLIAICADHEQTQSASLADVLRAISVPAEDLEAEEVVLGDDNAVHLMTIHGSKGLEFPIVALAGLNTQLKMPSAITSHQMGPTLSFPEEQVDPTDLLQTLSLPPVLSHTVNKFIFRRREEAQDRRLLYVALTRAKSHLILATAPSDDVAKASGLLSILMNAISHKGAWEIWRAPDITDELTAYTQQADAVTPTGVDATPLAPPTPELMTASQLALRHTSAATQQSARRIITTDTSSPAYGSAVHSALSEVIRMDPETESDEITQRIISILSHTELSRTEALRALNEVTSVLTMPIVAERRADISSAVIEGTLLALHGDTVVEGVLDVRFVPKDGVVEVWDWKTNHVRSADHLSMLSDHYKVQMQTYAWLCSKAVPDCRRVVTRLIFTKAINAGIDACDVVHQWSIDDITLPEC
ncbi:MAG: hypothetical protein FGM32_05100 [Candidatus Kapabacteria bacterium]|nr:hypothetical protein [Candidatus Kapabacteria bacterium]